MNSDLKQNTLKYFHDYKDLSAVLKLTFVNTIKNINKQDWQRLVNSTCPFLQYDYFEALESSLSACSERGWQPHHLVIKKNNNTIAIVPLYLKDHSWGEYVFDWAWAEAYERYNLPYYPKLVATVPFTPITTPKILSQTLSFDDILPLVIEHCLKSNIASFHILFIPFKNTAKEVTGESEKINALEINQRHTVQFHWFNKGYSSFEAYLATFTSRKRKNTKKERASIEQQGINVQRLIGKDISQKEIDYFYLAYQLTYLKKGHQPHLTHAFFIDMFTKFADNLLLVIATVKKEDVEEDVEEDGYIACALFFYDEDTLYGRYWGCSENIKNLHFELCYYQGIDFCIANNLKNFNPGTQGEHKIKRGFEPVLTHSYHWVNQQAFKPAIAEFCLQERKQMTYYLKQCQQLLPFKNTLA